jgi:hypothetical protein
VGYAVVKRIVIFGVVATAALVSLSGCQGTEDNQYTDQAPPPSANAQSVTPPPNKVRMGADGAAGAGAGAGANAPETSKPLAKPGGM